MSPCNLAYIREHSGIFESAAYARPKVLFLKCSLTRTGGAIYKARPNLPATVLSTAKRMIVRTAEPPMAP